MPAWLQFILHNLHFVIIVLVALSGVLNKILKASKEVARQREEAIRREREELDRLRTGRSADAPSPMMGGPAEPVPQPGARQGMTLEEAAEARQRRMREARARQQPRPVGAAQPPESPRQAPQRTRTITLPGGIVLEVPIEDGDIAQGPATSPPPPRPTQRQGQRSAQRPAQRQPQRQGQRSQQPRQPQRPQPQPAAPVSQEPPRAGDGIEPSTHRLVMDAPSAGNSRSRLVAPPTASRAGVFLASGASRRDEMRKAIVLSELLRPPITMREGESDTLRDVIGAAR